MHRPQAHVPALLQENRRRYEFLVELVEHHAARGDAERVLRAATLAANYAWLAPVGLLSDPRVERAVVQAVRGPQPVVVDGDRHTGRVLHVLSEAYAIGGHTRLATRWMDRDHRTSDVVLTNQQGPVPERLVESARAAGGDLVDLRASTPEFLDRARALRRLMDRADVVVLTVHAYDAVALAAVNLPGTRPPVVHVNHADHPFWLGVAGADLLCDWRAQARGLGVSLRGLPDERIHLLPLPVDELPPASGDALRAELRIRPDAVVAVTVTDDWKVAPAWGRGMHHVVDRALQWAPRLTVVLVGVTPDADWARLAKRHPGRVLVVGRVPDPAPYLALADLFLESYPVRAGTTPLEAAMAGLPVVALADLPEDDPGYIFATGSPGLDGITTAPTVEAFTLAVRRLVEDPALRARQGAEVQAAVRDAHDGPGWVARLEAVYAHARSLPAIDVDTLAEPVTDDRYGAMLLSAVAPGPASPDPRQMTGPLGELFDSRLRADLQAALSRDQGPSFRVRVAAAWHQHPAWTARLLDLSSAQRRLAVSLPFLPGDGVHGERTEATLVALLARSGRTPENCGDISVDGQRPRRSGPELNGELPFTDDALDWLEELVSSPLWSAPADAGAGARPRTVVPALS